MNNQRLSRVLTAEFGRQIAAFLETHQSNVARLAEIAEGMRRFKAGFPMQILTLAQHGWFIASWHTPLEAVYPLADFFRSGNATEGHKQMSAHFAEIRQDIENDMTERFPERRRILQKAFKAHDVGDYELSVPVFLAQADGIAKKNFGRSILSRKKRSEMRGEIAGIASQGLDESLLSLVLEDLPLTENTDSTKYHAGDLNRHAVLHGLNTKYATKLNSFKAISFLQYAADFERATQTQP